jgi:hypothetical protein
VSLKIKDFAVMSEDEKTLYKNTWSQYRQEVALATCAAIQYRFGIKYDEVDFKDDIKIVTNQDEILTAHMIIDVHKIFDKTIDELNDEPYKIYDSLFDFVLTLSSELTDKELGYVTLFEEIRDNKEDKLVE